MMHTGIKYVTTPAADAGPPWDEVRAAAAESGTTLLGTYTRADSGTAVLTGAEVDLASRGLVLYRFDTEPYSGSGA